MVKNQGKHLKNLRCGYCRKFIKCSNYKTHIILEHLEQEKEKYANSTQLTFLTCPICHIEMLEFRFFNHLLVFCNSQIYTEINNLANSLKHLNDTTSFKCFTCKTIINGDTHDFYIHFVKNHNRLPTPNEAKKYATYVKKNSLSLSVKSTFSAIDDKDWSKPWYEVSGGKCSPR